MGGSIGMGMPVATGAAVACPDRKVVCLEGDGSGMYTLQALWTQAREGLDVTTLLFSNRTYAILQGRARQCRRRQPRPQGARHARYRPPRSRLGGSRALDGRARARRSRRWKSSTTALPRGSPPPARSSSRSCCRPSASLPAGREHIGELCQIVLAGPYQCPHPRKCGARRSLRPSGSYHRCTADLLLRIHCGLGRPVLWQRQPLGHQLAALGDKALVE